MSTLSDPSGDPPVQLLNLVDGSVIALGNGFVPGYFGFGRTSLVAFTPDSRWAVGVSRSTLVVIELDTGEVSPRCRIGRRASSPPWRSALIPVGSVADPLSTATVKPTTAPVACSGVRCTDNPAGHRRAGGVPSDDVARRRAAAVVGARPGPLCSPAGRPGARRLRGQAAPARLLPLGLRRSGRRARRRPHRCRRGLRAPSRSRSSTTT